MKLKKVLTPKDGDFITFEWENHSAIGIFDGTAMGYSPKRPIPFHAVLSNYDNSIQYDVYIDSFAERSDRKSTEVEKQKLLYHLFIKGYGWDNEEKCLINYNEKETALSANDAINKIRDILNKI
jgi:hypothetical protein